MNPLKIKPGTTWSETWARCVAAAPEAFYQDRLHNLIGGEWRPVGVPGEHSTPLDGTPIPGPPRVSPEEAEQAVAFAVGEHKAWGDIDLDERKAPGAGRTRCHGRAARPAGAAAGLGDRQAVAAGLRRRRPRASTACAGTSSEIERQLTAEDGASGAAARPGQQHRQLELSDERAGARRAGAAAGRQRGHRQDADPGRLALPDARARASCAAQGLPVTLLSGVGGELGDALIRGDEHRRARLRRRAGQRAQGGDVAGRHRQAAHARAGGPERLGHLGLLPVGAARAAPEARASSTPSSAAPPTRATSCSGAVRPRSSRRTCRWCAACGSATRSPSRPTDDPLPDLDFGPVIHAAKAADLGERLDEAIRGGGIPLYRGSLDDGRFLWRPGPLGVRAAVLRAGPAGELVAAPRRAVRAAGLGRAGRHRVGAAGRDERLERLARRVGRDRRRALAARVAEELQAFKVGINKPRSRGDREEVFGGKGASWKGAFVGGDLLVQRRHRRPRRGEGTALRQLPVVLALPADLTPSTCPGRPDPAGSAPSRRETAGVARGRRGRVPGWPS